MAYNHKFLCSILICALFLIGLMPGAQADGMVLTVAPEKTSVTNGDTLHWSTRLVGGAGEITYTYALSRDGAAIKTESDKAGEYWYNTGIDGTYSLTVVARDASGNASNTAKSADVVVKSTCESITLDKSTVTIACGQSIMPVHVTILPEGAQPELMWSVPGTDPVSIDQKTGKILGRSVGGTYVTVRAVGSTAHATYYVNVVQAGTYIDKIALNLTSAVGVVGGKLQLKATLSPSDALNPTIVWTTSNPAVATVSEKGLVTAVGSGSATITASAYGDVTATCEIIIDKTKNKNVTQVKLDRASVTGIVGSKLALKASVSPSDASNPSLLWESSDEKIATVDQNGWVTAVKKGSCWIRAMAQDGTKKYALCKVTVSGGAIAVTRVQLNRTAAAGVIGGKLALKATVSPKNAGNQTLLWESSDENVATVDQTGLVTAAGKGSCYIRAKAQDGSDKYALCKITVQSGEKAVTQVKLNRTAATGIPGGSLQLKATVSPATATDKSILWETSDANVATVDQTGLVTAVGKGNCWIRAMAQDGSEKFALCKVRVIGGDVSVKGVKLNRTAATGVVGGKLQLKATISPASASKTELLWESSDPAVATVDQTGLVTAVGKGNCWIRAKAQDDDGKYALCAIRVA